MLKNGCKLFSVKIYKGYYYVSADIGSFGKQSDIEEKQMNTGTYMPNGFEDSQKTNQLSNAKLCDNVEQNLENLNLDLSDLNKQNTEPSAKTVIKTSASETRKPDVGKTVGNIKGNNEKTKLPSPRDIGDISPREKPVPTTSFQFQADYKTMRQNSEAFYQYLKVLLLLS